MRLLVAGFTIGPLSPFDLAVIEEVAIVDGDELHLLHVADGHDRSDGVVDFHNLAGVLDLLVLGRTGRQVVSRRFF